MGVNFHEIEFPVNSFRIATTNVDAIPTSVVNRVPRLEKALVEWVEGRPGDVSVINHFTNEIEGGVKRIQAGYVVSLLSMIEGMNSVIAEMQNKSGIDLAGLRAIVPEMALELMPLGAKREEIIEKHKLDLSARAFHARASLKIS